MSSSSSNPVRRTVIDSDRPHRTTIEVLPEGYAGVVFPLQWMDRLPTLTTAAMRVALLLLQRANTALQVDKVGRYGLSSIRGGKLVEENICELCDLSESGVSNVVTTMEKWGWLSKGRRSRDAGGGEFYQIHLHPDDPADVDLDAPAPTAVGAGADAGGRAPTAVGAGADAGGRAPTAVGAGADAGGRAPTAVGAGADAGGRAPTAVGAGADAGGRAPTAVGAPHPSIHAGAPTREDSSLISSLNSREEINDDVERTRSSDDEWITTILTDERIGLSPGQVRQVIEAGRTLDEVLAVLETARLQGEKIQRLAGFVFTGCMGFGVSFTPDARIAQQRLRKQASAEADLHAQREHAAKAQSEQAIRAAREADRALVQQLSDEQCRELLAAHVSGIENPYVRQFVAKSNPRGGTMFQTIARLARARGLVPENSRAGAEGAGPTSERFAGVDAPATGHGSGIPPSRA